MAKAEDGVDGSNPNIVRAVQHGFDPCIEGRRPKPVQGISRCRVDKDAEENEQNKDTSGPG
jgi:hypothetical protein